MATSLKIGILIGSTRPGRVGESVGKWVFEKASSRQDEIFELIDLATFNLPLLDEPAPPMLMAYTQPHTKAWSAIIQQYDGFVFVTPEYNHGIPGALKNALDYLFHEWSNKSIGFVSYGSAGGVRAVEQLRMITAALQMAGVRESVSLNLFTDFAGFSVFKPAEIHIQKLNAMLDQIVSWGLALKHQRNLTLQKSKLSS
jgi:NAD(P)H-dependent FMN reductase